MSGMYPTSYLEHFANLYTNHLLSRHGISLDQYLADPARYEPLLYKPFPLLPEQTRVRVRLIREEIQEQTEDELQGSLTLQNEAFVEPMRHHRHPKRRGKLCSFQPTQNPFPQTI